MIDDGGFIIMHYDWLELDDNQQAYKVHISAKEPGVAKKLIEDDIMQEMGCHNHAELLRQSTWRVSTSIPQSS